MLLKGGHCHLVLHLPGVGVILVDNREGLVAQQLGAMPLQEVLRLKPALGPEEG